MRDPGTVFVVIPAHNRLCELRRTLEALAREDVGQQVAVVDDASTDGTWDWLQANASAFGVTRVIRMQHTRGAAAARNAGLQASLAPLCLFLDADVVVPSGFLREVLGHSPAAREVGLLPVMGAAQADGTWPLLAPPPEVPFAPTDPRWSRLRDMRHCASDPDGFLDHLPAPWVYCWSAALALNTELAREVGGFAADLPGKGSEDIEFGFRLHEAHARFRLLPVPAAMHWPHGRARTLEERADRDHERVFLARHPILAVEMLCAFDPSNANSALIAVMSGLAACCPLVEPPPGPIGFRPPGSLLLFGGAWAALEAELSADVVLDPLQTVPLPGRLPLAGFALPFPDHHFDAAVVPRLSVWPESLQARILQEAARVARNTFVVCRDAVEPEVPGLTELAVRTFDRPYWERSAWISRWLYDWRATNIASFGQGPQCGRVVRVVSDRQTTAGSRIGRRRERRQTA